MSVVFETGHAFGIVAEDGAELLIHSGFDTVKEKGEGFTTYVKNGDNVRAGQLLASFDKKYLTGRGYDLTIPLVFTNMDSVEITKIADYGKVSAGSFVLNYIQK
jgi:phosphotransferase system IIA component